MGRTPCSAGILTVWQWPTTLDPNHQCARLVNLLDILTLGNSNNSDGEELQRETCIYRERSWYVVWLHSILRVVTAPQRMIFVGGDVLNSSIKTASAPHVQGAQLQMTICAQSQDVEGRYMSMQTEINQTSAPIAIGREFPGWVDSKMTDSTDH